MLIHNKDDIELVTEFPCFLGHPVQLYFNNFQQFKKFCLKKLYISNNIGQIPESYLLNLGKYL